MATRLPIAKTYKLFIKGQFPRSESGRSLVVADSAGRTVAHLCRASRKDLRDAVTAARGALAGWGERSAYNRGQIIYRMAEMVEGKRRELEESIAAVGAAKKPSGKKKSGAKTGAPVSAAREVEAAIDRLVAYAGWADKFSQVLGCNNAVNGPFYNFSIAEPTGVIGVVAPDEPSLLGLVSLVAPAVCAGNTVVVLASETNPIPACVLAEALATSDLPGGVVNILTGERAELVAQFAGHRDIDGLFGAGLAPEHASALRAGSAENLKRVTVVDGVSSRQWLDEARCEGPWWIERLVEIKTVWHPSAS